MSQICGRVLGRFGQSFRLNQLQPMQTGTGGRHFFTVTRCLPSRLHLTSATTQVQTAAFTSKAAQLATPWKILIRPHYYQGKASSNSSLSQALKQQQNPFRKWGRKINNADPNKVLWAVIGTNVGVYLLWQYSIKSYTQFHDGSWLNFMLSNFIVSPDNIDHGRYHTLLTASVSHKDLSHLGLNMLVLYSMGQGVIEAIGASRFLLLYGAAGITASLATLAYRKYLRPALEKGRMIREPRNMGSLGASGSVMGITTFFACAFPRATFMVFFVIPMPAIAVVGAFAAYDIYKASTLQTGIVDSAGHLGGVAYGAAYWFLRVKPLLKAGRWR